MQALKQKAQHNFEQIEGENAFEAAAVETQIREMESLLNQMESELAGSRSENQKLRLVVNDGRKLDEQADNNTSNAADNKLREAKAQLQQVESDLKRQQQLKQDALRTFDDILDN